jgi:hypothetical protein
MIDFEEVKKQQLEYRRAISTKRIPLDFDRARYSKLPF